MSRQPQTAQQQQQQQQLHQQPTIANLEVPIEPLDESTQWKDIITSEKQLVERIRENMINPKEDVGDCNLLPCELISNKIIKPKVNPKLRIDPIKLAMEEVDDEEAEAEDEEDEDNEDEEQVVDEEEDAGGDYLVSHFDNGEGFEENDTEDDDMGDHGR